MTEDRPRYRRIAEDIAADIEGGLFPVGDLLPSKRSIADNRGVSFGTVDRAIELLTEWGLIQGKQGVGYYVRSRTRQQVKSAADEFAEIKARLDRIEQQLGLKDDGL